MHDQSTQRARGNRFRVPSQRGRPISLPSALADFLQSLALQGRGAAYLRLDENGVIRDSGGELSRYAITSPKAGEDGETAAPFLCGLFPLAGRSATFRWLEVAPGVTADLHLMEHEGVRWVLLLDATDDAARHQAFQQKGNEITLERDRLRRRVAELEAELERLKASRAG